MERNIENELMTIKRDISSLRDKAVSAKAMMASAENQIGEHLAGLAQLIEETKREEFNVVSVALQNDLNSEEAARNLADWIENYTSEISRQNIEMIDSLNETIEHWKEITGQKEL